MKKILIVKTSAIGDIIQSFDVLSYLREKFPKAQIDWVVEEEAVELLLAHPLLSNVIAMRSKEWRRNLGRRATWIAIKDFFKELRKTRYDLAIDLQRNSKSGLVHFFVKARLKLGYGWKTASEWPNCLASNRRCNPPLGLNIRDEYLYLVRDFLGDKTPYVPSGILLNADKISQQKIEMVLGHPSLQGKERILLCPGTAWWSKQVEEEALSHFIRQVGSATKAMFLLLWGNEGEKNLAMRLAAQNPGYSLLLNGRFRLTALQNLITHMDAVVSMDSLPLHLAGTTGTPTFAVFGPSSASKFLPRGKQHRGVQGSCPYGVTFDNRCPHLRTCKVAACTKGLTGEFLVAQYLKWRLSTCSAKPQKTVRAFPVTADA